MIGPWYSMLPLRFSISAHVMFNWCREHVIDTRPLEKEKGGIYSMFYTRPEETGSQLHQTPRTEFPSFGSKRVGAMHHCPASDKGWVMLRVTSAIPGLQMVDYVIWSATGRASKRMMHRMDANRLVLQSQLLKNWQKANRFCWEVKRTIKILVKSGEASLPGNSIF